MHDDQDKKQQAKELEQALNKGLSRRAFLDGLKAIGAGFGAAFVFGVHRLEAAVPADGLVNLTSTDPALNDIVEDSQRGNAAAASSSDEEARVRLAQYGRLPYGRIGYRRVPYPRVYGRVVPYGRVIPYGRVTYPRVVYPRVYGRVVYPRVPYARFPNYGRMF
jgi:hypothetical protein